MRPALCLLLVSGTLLVSSTAEADRGGLALDLGGGMSLQRVPAPYCQTGQTFGFAPEVQLRGRYAVRNYLEVGLTGFFEIPGTYFHNAVTVELDGRRYPGTLQHTYTRFAGLAGVRAILGTEWRPFVQLDVGWALHQVSNLKHIDDSVPAYPQDYRLDLQPTSRSSLLLAASAGLQWSGDRFIVEIAPRIDLSLGGASTFNVTIPVAIGWTFYP